MWKGRRELRPDICFSADADCGLDGSSLPNDPEIATTRGRSTECRGARQACEAVECVRSADQKPSRVLGV